MSRQVRRGWLFGGLPAMSLAFVAAAAGAQSPSNHDAPQCRSSASADERARVASAQHVPDPVAYRMFFRMLAVRAAAVPAGSSPSSELAHAQKAFPAGSFSAEEVATLLAVARELDAQISVIDRKAASVARSDDASSAASTRLAELRGSRDREMAVAMAALPGRLGPALHEKLRAYCRERVKPNITQRPATAVSER